MNVAGYLDLCNKNYIKTYGKVVKVVGLTVESTGPEAKVGDTCRIALAGSDKTVLAEVVGFTDGRLQLMPYEDISGVQIGDYVEGNCEAAQVPVGPELLGMV